MPPRRLAHPIPVPHEHGAWTMLAIPLILGLRVGPPGAAPLLVVPAMTLLFFARYALVPLGARLVEGRAPPPGLIAARLGWGAVFLAGSLLAFAGALLLAEAAHRPAALRAGAATVALGLGHSALVLAGWHRVWWGEAVGMAGLASAAPLILAVAGRPLDRRALGLAAICLVYFLSTLAYVRAFRTIVREGGGGGDGLPGGRRADDGGAARRCAAAHALLAAAVAALWRAGFVPGAAVWAFVPVLVRTAWGLRRPPRTLRILGWREVIVAALFTGLALAAL
jgi:hypothetical protein